MRALEALIRSPRRATLVPPRPTTSRIEERRGRFLLGTATSILVALATVTAAGAQVGSPLRLKAIYPHWIAGGARIAFLGWDGRRDQGFKLVRIWVMNADGRRRRALTRAVPNSPYELPVLSPSGRRFADVFDYGNKLVGWIGWPSGKTIWEKTLVRFAATYSLPSWSPDERAVAVEVETDLPGGRGMIFVEELKGRLHQIGHLGSRHDSLAAWSPDSRRLAFVSCLHIFRSSCDLVVIRRDGSGRKVVARHVGRTGSPVWAPNGQTLEYSVGFGRVREAQWKDCSRCDPLELQRQTIYIVRPDGSGRRRVTTTSYLERDSAPALAWSPDNRRLAFTNGTPFAPRLRDRLSIDVTIVGVNDSSARRRVVRGASQSAWSPDGRQLAVVDRRGVTIVNANDGTQHRLTSLRHVDDLAWAPSTRILFSDQGDLYTALPRTRPRRILP